MLKPFRLTANIPRTLEPLIKRRMHDERYRSESMLVLGLIINDLLTKHPHRLTGPLLREPHWVVETFVQKLAEDFDSKPPAACACCAFKKLAA